MYTRWLKKKSGLSDKYPHIILIYMHSLHNKVKVYNHTLVMSLRLVDDLEV